MFCDSVVNEQGALLGLIFTSVFSFGSGDWVAMLAVQREERAFDLFRIEKNNK